MKNSLKIAFLLIAGLVTAQNVILNQVVATNTNSDKFLYKINQEIVGAQYLGELEVQGFSEDDVQVFGMIYKKAKQIGANAFALHPFEAVDRGMQPFDPAHYRFKLYYVQPVDFADEENTVYLLGAALTAQKISVDGNSVQFQPRSFLKISLQDGKILSISTKKLLGSSIKLTSKPGQPAQYYQISGFSVNANPYGSAGINLKSGDIIRLEKSYADFLITIYEMKN